MATRQCLILNIFIILCLSGIIMARPKSGQHYSQRQEISFEDPFDVDEVYNEMRFPENDPNSLTNWPWLRELVPNENEIKDNIDYNLYREKIYDHLKQPYHELPELLPTAVPLIYKTEKPMAINSIKDRTDKKNNYYMSLCHFKICNMGRKRNTRYLHLLDMIDNLRGTSSDSQGAM